LSRVKQHQIPSCWIDNVPKCRCCKRNTKEENVEDEEEDTKRVEHTLFFGVKSRECVQKYRHYTSAHVYYKLGVCQLCLHHSQDEYSSTQAGVKFCTAHLHPFLSCISHSGRVEDVRLGLIIVPIFVPDPKRLTKVIPMAWVRRSVWVAI
jgi:hypothetical protein